ncbi:MAG: anhydro-N-acetylmuramic acid kinase [Methylophilaceae bacterium]
MASQLFIGIMSGTSLDGVDAALCEFSDEGCKVLSTHFLAYPAHIKSELLSLHFPSENELENAVLMANQLAQLYAQTTNELLSKNSLKYNKIKAIGCHGQTIRHRPEHGFTLQIGNNALLAELTNISVVADFRSRDIAAGGHGAPLVPAFHQAVFGSNTKSRAILNIGGIANITYLAKTGEVLGFDSGPGNMLLDCWAKQKINEDYDANGDWAATGVVHDSFLNHMLAEPYFAEPPPKSTGRDLFNELWLKQRTFHPHCRPQDIARTLVELSALTISNAISQYCPALDEVYVCGGGAHNALLMQRLAERIKGATLLTTDTLGVGVDWVEAAAFAWLAKQTLENKPGNLPKVTGASGLRVLGAIYPA